MPRTIALFAAVALAHIVAACATGPAAAPAETAPTLVQPGGTYETVPLSKDEVVLKIIQSSAENPKVPADATRVIESNLARVTKLIEKACTEGEKPDILLLHEFPLTGYIYGTRAAKLSIALRIPGPESDAICALAKKHDTWIIFGSYAQDPEWPGHVLSLTTIVGRDGTIVAKVWKPRNIKRFYSTFEITTTTVEGVKDRFRENRRLPQYSLTLTRHVFDQYEEEIPANHLDMPEEQLPKDGKEMKALLDRESRWKKE